MLWSSVFVTRVSNKLMLNTSLRMAYDSRYKNAVVHGVVYGISKMLHCAIERFLISILMKINFFVLQRIEESLIK